MVCMDTGFSDILLRGFLTMAKKVTRVAIYTRVSTTDQSTERQIRELRAYAESRGWEIVHEAEEHVSGAAEKRPQREKILDMARKRKIDAILVLSLDRWGRSVKDLVLSVEELESLGVAFVVPGNIDMTTPMGKMMAHLLSAVAEFERELIRERVRSGLANAKAKGRIGGRPRKDVEQGLALLRQGKSFNAVSRETGISVSTLQRAKRELN
jgi:DNA invertase Pin-like site-specific DNA recombinase